MNEVFLFGFQWRGLLVEKQHALLLHQETAEVSVSLTGSWTWASVFCVHSEGDIDLSSYVALRHAQRAAVCYGASFTDSFKKTHRAK